MNSTGGLEPILRLSLLAPDVVEPVLDGSRSSPGLPRVIGPWRSDRAEQRVDLGLTAG